jgi:hypothetical protein
MGTGRNFYKNPAFLYDNQSKLSSALDNLRAYNLATGNVSGKIQTRMKTSKEAVQTSLGSAEGIIIFRIIIHCQTIESFSRLKL